LDFNWIIASPCCAELCLCKFDVSQIWACCIWYLSMTQAASHQWLRTLMENQQLHHQLYHLHHQVLSTLQLIGDSFLTTPVVCLQAGVHACLWNLQEQNGQLLHCGYSLNWKDLHQHYSSGQCMDNHVHQHGITSLIYCVCVHNRIC
jgi:hypothetical protein